MNNSIYISGLTVVALSVMLISVVWTDIKTHRIRNEMVIMIVLLGLISQLIAHGAEGVIQGLGGMAVGLALLLPFYIGGGMGAGDVKLLAGVGTILGPLSTLVAGGITLIVGAPLALWYLIRRHHRVRLLKQQAVTVDSKQRVTASMPRSARKERLPYAVAIAVGTIAGLWHSGRMQDLIGAIT